MQKVIDQITDHLVTLVTNEKEVYNPKELLKSGIPSFVVERIRLLLEDKVKEEIGEITPQWFDSESRLVSDALTDYIRSAISSSHIPKAHLYEIINTVVKDIIYVFIEPRKHMAEYIFREDEELSLIELEERCALLTIYKHFGTAIPLYMKKRELEALTKERCKILIHKLDAKLVASYTAQDWAQKLEQLFILFGGKVDPLLLATFFEDKGLYGMAGKFENLTDSITKSDFISLLSAEDLTGFSPEFKTKKLDEIDEEIATNEVEKISEKEEEEQSLIEDFFGNYESTPVKEDETLANQFVEGGLSDDEMSELLSDIASDGVVEVDENNHVDSLNKLFSLSTDEEQEQVSETTEEIAAKIKEQEGDDPEEIIEFRENLISILDQAKSSFENIESKEEDVDDEIIVEDDLANVFTEEEEIIEEEKTEEIDSEVAEIETDENGKEEKPMWAQFINEDQMDVIMGGERNRSEEPEEVSEDTIAEVSDDDLEFEVDDIYVDNPFMETESETTISSEPEPEVILLETILEDRRTEFIEVIFKDSRDDYYKTIKKIDEFESWKETSTFIQKKVFAKNKVDMFSGATVDFTDRLHRYFNGKMNS